MAEILFLTELLPYPLVSGAKIRIYYVLRYLARRHRVTLLSFVRSDDRPEYVDHLQTFLHQVHIVPMRRSWPRNLRAGVVSMLTGRPAIIAREEVGAMRREVKRLLASGRFDAVHADQIPMAQYGLLGEGAGVKRVLDQHNATFQIVERLARDEKSLLRRRFLVREAGAFVRYETAVCQRYDHVTFVTEEDRQALVGRMSDRSLLRRSTVIPICIDTESVAPVLPGSTPFRVTHIGTMYWPPNVEGILWFWEEIWPRVQVQVPEACLTLIGKNPGPRIQALGDGPNVEVVGYVEDVAPYLSETAVFIVPLRAAGGMRVKILDAWCWGLPIVSTMIGAEGITIREGENILIADAPEVFSEAVVQLLRDADNARQLRTNGRRWVEDRYDWRRVYRAWDTVYDQLLQAS